MITKEIRLRDISRNPTNQNRVIGSWFQSLDIDLWRNKGDSFMFIKRAVTQMEKSTKKSF